MAFRERRSIFSPARGDDDRARDHVPAPRNRSSRSRSPPHGFLKREGSAGGGGPPGLPPAPGGPPVINPQIISAPPLGPPAPVINPPYVGTGYGNNTPLNTTTGFWNHDVGMFNKQQFPNRPPGVYGYDLMMGPNEALPVNSNAPSMGSQHNANAQANAQGNHHSGDRKKQLYPCISFLVPNESVPLVIGRKGENIQAIAQITNSYINVANRPYDTQGDCTDRIVRVMRNKYGAGEESPKDPEALRLWDHGFFNCVDAVKESIKVAFPRIPERGEFKLIVLLSKEQSLKIIGVGGDNVHKIMNATGCEIDIRKGDEGQEDEEMTLTGMMCQISGALDRMGEALFDLDPGYTLRKTDEPKKHDHLDLGNIDDLPFRPVVRINLGKCNMNALVGKDISFTKHILDACREKKRPVDSVDLVQTGDGTTWVHIEGDMEAVSKSVKVAWTRFMEMQEKCRRRVAKEKDREREREREEERQRRERERELERERKERQRAEERAERERQRELERERARERDERIDREREQERREQERELQERIREREREVPLRYERNEPCKSERQERERSPRSERKERERSPRSERQDRERSPRSERQDRERSPRSERQERERSGERQERDERESDRDRQERERDRREPPREYETHSPEADYGDDHISDRGRSREREREQQSERGHSNEEREGKKRSRSRSKRSPSERERVKREKSKSSRGRRSRSRASSKG